jgi:hypothetical protein
VASSHGLQRHCARHSCCADCRLVRVEPRLSRASRCSRMVLLTPPCFALRILACCLCPCCTPERRHFPVPRNFFAITQSAARPFVIFPRLASLSTLLGVTDRELLSTGAYQTGRPRASCANADRCGSNIVCRCQQWHCAHILHGMSCHM